MGVDGLYNVHIHYSDYDERVTFSIFRWMTFVDQKIRLEVSCVVCTHARCMQTAEEEFQARVHTHPPRVEYPAHAASSGLSIDRAGVCLCLSPDPGVRRAVCCPSSICRPFETIQCSAVFGSELCCKTGLMLVVFVVLSGVTVCQC